MIARTLAFVVALAFGFVLSQGPEFAQQYRQRLGGTVDELRRIVEQFDADSLRSGYGRAAALTVMGRDSEQLVRDQAGRMIETIARYERLSQQEEAFRNDGPFRRLVSFVRNFDPPLVKRTFASYEPAMPVTAEGLLLTAGGFLAGYVLVLAAAWPVRRRRSQVRAGARLIAGEYDEREDSQGR